MAKDSNSLGRSVLIASLSAAATATVPVFLNLIPGFWNVFHLSLGTIAMLVAVVAGVVFVVTVKPRPRSKPRQRSMAFLAGGVLIIVILYFGLTLKPMSYENDIDRNGGDDYADAFVLSHITDPHACQQTCQKDYQCRAYTYVPPGGQGPNDPYPHCWLKKQQPLPWRHSGMVSGIRMD